MSIIPSIVLVLKEGINFINPLSSSLSIKDKTSRSIGITIYSIVIPSI